MKMPKISKFLLKLTKIIFRDQSEEDLMLLLVAFKEENDRLQAEIGTLKDDLEAQQAKAKTVRALKYSNCCIFSNL